MFAIIASGGCDLQVCRCPSPRTRDIGGKDPDCPFEKRKVLKATAKLTSSNRRRRPLEAFESEKKKRRRKEEKIALRPPGACQGSGGVEEIRGRNLS